MSSIVFTYGSPRTEDRFVKAKATRIEIDVGSMALRTIVQQYRESWTPGGAPELTGADMRISAPLTPEVVQAMLAAVLPVLQAAGIVQPDTVVTMEE